MGEVVYINNAVRGEGEDFHMTGDVLCTACKNEWTGVVPVGTHELECPRCHTMKGVFKHHLAPVTNEVWACNCGNKLFFILKNDIQCIECGTTTNKNDVYDEKD